MSPRTTSTSTYIASIEKAAPPLRTRERVLLNVLAVVVVGSLLVQGLQMAYLWAYQAGELQGMRMLAQSLQCQGATGEGSSYHPDPLHRHEAMLLPGGL